METHYYTCTKLKLVTVYTHLHQNDLIPINSLTWN